MSTSNPLVTVLIDGLSAPLVTPKDMPFLHGLGEKGVNTRLQPIFAFRGIEPTIFTGVSPDAHGIWTEFQLKPVILSYGPKASRQFKFHSFYELLTRLELSINMPDKARRLPRLLLARVIGRDEFSTLSNIIPFDHYAFFEHTLKSPVTTLRLRNVLTLFDLLRDFDLPFAFIAQPFCTSDTTVLSTLHANLQRRAKLKFWYIKLDSLDGLGHKYHPTSLRLRSGLRHIDRTLENLYMQFQRRFRNFQFMVFADHGMAAVRGGINLARRLLDINMKEGKDYLIFLNSTVMQVWFFDDSAEEFLRTRLSYEHHGHFLSERERTALHVPKSRIYGDALYVLDEGYVANPDFFRSSSFPVGMHGYAYARSEYAYPALVADESMRGSVNSPLEFLDLFNLLRKALEV